LANHSRVTPSLRSAFTAAIYEFATHRLLLLNQPHLERILRVFVDHYNQHRPHRALSLAPPQPQRAATTVAVLADACILRRDRLGGIVHEDELAA
jgi:putative transposase